MSKPRKPADEQEMRLRVEARLHDGVIPVPFLGKTWLTRGAAYWRRRAGAVVVMVLALALVGGMTVGFTIGIVGDGSDAIRIALAVLYDLTVVAGVRTGLRKIAAAPLDDRRGGPGTHVPNGLLAFVLAPFGTGLVLTILLAMFGRDFIGERRARELSHPKPR
ncbi:hypothetical protein [Actinoplanes subtropicus]|uniref:hypothetical protein n=1 Tax=Actinoplanes subtropicus TaxID=543632 RepID=UPI0004C465D9|nr:hypothetical protein [Actinoplanes subtropicus]